jgi:hypothetical protein
MSKVSKLETLLVEKSKSKLLTDVHTLDPQLLLSWFNKENKNFELLVKKVAKVMKANPKLVTKIREGK